MLLTALVASTSIGQENETKKTTEPVFRVSKLSHSNNIPEPNTPVKPIESFLQPTIDPFAEPATPKTPIKTAPIKKAPAKTTPPVAPVTPTTNSPNNAAPVHAVPEAVKNKLISSMPNAAAGANPSSTTNLLAVTPNATPSLLPSAAKPVTSRHPLDSAIDLANNALSDMRSEVFDYTAILVKREQVKGSVGPAGYVQLKIRCPRQTQNGRTPFSIYMKFLKPRESAGREVIWVEGQNDNKLVVHEGKGRLIGMRRFNLDPTGFLAMKDNRHPIYEAGLENLIIKLIEKAERDRSAGPCNVVYRDGAQINKRPCSVIELTHDEQRAPYEFHKAQVFIDTETQLPVRYAAYDWPTSPGATPKLQEEYTYVNVKLNVGLTDLDFNPDNPAYSFPGR